MVENEPKAERLTEVGCKDNAEKDLIVPEIVNGQVRVRKGGLIQGAYADRRRRTPSALQVDRQRLGLGQISLLELALAEVL